jgi:4-amino-4-deoxy-L-arabinose transferase-like glycosyltransferase
VRTAAALFVIVAVAASLRIWGIDYGIPHPTARPDEERVVGRAQTIFATGEWHPGSFYYPSLPFYLDTLVLHAYYQAKKALGDYQRPFDFLFEIAVTRPGLHYRISRMVSAVSGVLNVLAVFALSLAAYRRRGGALLAALALAVCHVHVRDSHFATVDVLMTLFVTLSLWFSLRGAASGARLDFVLSGLFAGLAISSKYNAGLVLIAAVTAASLRRREALGTLALTAGAALLAFTATSPYVVLRWGAFWSDMGFLRDFLYSSPQGELAFWDHLGFTLPHGLGWPLFLAAVLGTLRALRLRRQADLVLLSFCLPFFVLISSVRITFPRYVLPLLPVFVVFAADVVVSLLDRVSPGRARFLVGAVATAVLVAPTLSSSIAFDRIAARSDTRLETAKFLSEFFVPQTRFLVCPGYGAPEVNEDRRRPPAFVREEIDCSSGAIPPADARFLITHRHEQLASFSGVHPALASWLEERGELVTKFDPYRRRSRVTPRFFEADAFYIPFAGIGAVERGGPLIEIWKIEP